jgi:hypothetical protein
LTLGRGRNTVVWLRRGRGGEDVVEAPGEVAFEAADGFAFGLAFGLFAGEVSLGGRVVSGARDRDRV